MTDITPTDTRTDNPAMVYATIEETSRLLKEAINELRTNGHSHGSWLNNRGGKCTEGALAAATMSTDCSLDTLGHTMAMIEKAIGERIPGWNDRTDTTQVLGVLESLHTACELWLHEQSTAIAALTQGPVAALPATTETADELRLSTLAHATGTGQR